MPIRLSRHVRQLSPALVALALLSFIGCDGSQQPKQSGASASFKPADSVYREAAPGDRSSALQVHLNKLRKETFSVTTTDYDAIHDDAVYTAAYRHAVYLNTYNSSAWNSLALSGNSTNAINSDDSKIIRLLSEDLLPAGEFPALVTQGTPYQRIEAVRDGRSVLNSTGSDPRRVGEAYVFNGDIWRKDGTPSDYRGYNKDVLSDSDPTKYIFDAVDNVWYNRAGRMMLARPALRSFGYGNRSDSGQVPTIDAPFPIFNNRFLGVMNTVESLPLIARLGYWPSNANDSTTNGVHPYGLDTDIGGPNQYAGPPIHFTIPVDEPFLRDVGAVLLSFGRTDGVDPTSPPHNSITWRQYKVFSNVAGLVVPTIASPVNGFYRATGPVAPVVVDAVVTQVNSVAWQTPPFGQFFTFVLADTVDLTGVSVGDSMTIKIASGKPGTGAYTFNLTGVNAASHQVTFMIPVGAFGQGAFPANQFPSSLYGNDLTNVRIDISSTSVTNVTSIVDKNLRNGELVIVPVAPLQNDTRYSVTVRTRSASYDSGVIQWTFRTDKTGAYP